MARDPIRIVTELRRREVDQARRVFAECMAVERKLFEHIRQIDENTRKRNEEFSASPHKLVFIDAMYAAHAGAKRKRNAALIEWVAANQRTEKARAALTTARLAAKAVEQLAEERRVTRSLEEERRAQHVLDDVARSMRHAAETTHGSDQRGAST